MFEKYFENNINQITTKVILFSSDEILKMDMDKTISAIYNQLKLKPISLYKERISNSISSAILTRNEFPAGYAVMEDRIKVESADYFMPKSGDDQIFGIILRSLRLLAKKSMVNAGNVVLQYTNYGILNGNTPAIEKIKSEVLQDYDAIMQAILEYNNSITEENLKYEQIIKAEFNKRINAEQIKIDSVQNLNPFS
ncbi:MAG: hypothetical protein QM743_08820 [Chitinophagaceae bacterium]